MTSEEIYETIVQQSVAAVLYDTDKTVQYVCMQLWEADARMEQFTLPITLLELPVTDSSKINKNAKLKSEITAVVHIFTGVVALNDYIEKKKPLVTLARQIKQLLLTKIAQHPYVDTNGEIKLTGQEYYETEKNAYNPCGLFFSLTIPVQSDLLC